MNKVNPFILTTDADEPSPTIQELVSEFRNTIETLESKNEILII